jgi:hypothetical protein
MTSTSLAIVERAIDLGMHTLPLAAIAFGWRRLRRVDKEGGKLARVSVAAYSILTLTYLILFLFDVLSLRSEALSDKFVFSRVGLAFIYLNLAAGVGSAMIHAFRSNSARRSLVIASILVASACALDIVRAMDVGL